MAAKDNKTDTPDPGAGETTSPQAQQLVERDSAQASGETPNDISPLSAQEQNIRAAHSAEGGGAWPPDLLVEKATRASVPTTEAELYAQQAEQAGQDLDAERRVSESK